MKKEIYTIAIMSFSGRPTKSFSISRTNLIFVSIAIISFITISIGITSINVWNAFQKQAKETKIAIEKYEALQNDFQILQSELGNVRKSCKDVKTILGFNGIIVTESKEMAGEGGPEDIGIEKDIFEISDESIGDLKDNIDFALREAISLKSDLKNLLKNANSKFARLAEIPSICPIIVDPGNQYQVSSGFGLRVSPFTAQWEQHGGLDIVAVTGTPVMATADGIITGCGYNQFIGNFIVICHGEKYRTIYGHLNSFANGITTGTRVKRADLIGYVGNTGRSTGSHLHYEVRENGQRVNPLDYILN
ncbi:TPA: M23 family metallopeptidase [bacterium]|nr:M23 family metallopeptidase [bacterium]